MARRVPKVGPDKFSKDYANVALKHAQEINFDSEGLRRNINNKLKKQNKNQEELLLQDNGNEASSHENVDKADEKQRHQLDGTWNEKRDISHIDNGDLKAINSKKGPHVAYSNQKVRSKEKSNIKTHLNITKSNEKDESFCHKDRVQKTEEKDRTMGKSIQVYDVYDRYANIHAREQSSMEDGHARSLQREKDLSTKEKGSLEADIKKKESASTSCRAAQFPLNFDEKYERESAKEKLKSVVVVGTLRKANTQDKRGKDYSLSRNNTGFFFKTQPLSRHRKKCKKHLTAEERISNLVIDYFQLPLYRLPKWIFQYSTVIPAKVAVVTNEIKKETGVFENASVEKERQELEQVSSCEKTNTIPTTKEQTTVQKCCNCITQMEVIAEKRLSVVSNIGCDHRLSIQYSLMNITTTIRIRETRKFQSRTSHTPYFRSMFDDLVTEDPLNSISPETRSIQNNATCTTSRTEAIGFQFDLNQTGKKAMSMRKRKFWGKGVTVCGRIVKLNVSLSEIICDKSGCSQTRLSATLFQDFKPFSYGPEHKNNKSDSVLLLSDNWQNSTDAQQWEMIRHTRITGNSVYLLTNDATEPLCLRDLCRKIISTTASIRTVTGFQMDSLEAIEQFSTFSRSVTIYVQDEHRMRAPFIPNSLKCATANSILLKSRKADDQLLPHFRSQHLCKARSVSSSASFSFTMKVTDLPSYIFYSKHPGNKTSFGNRLEIITGHKDDVALPSIAVGDLVPTRYHSSIPPVSNRHCPSRCPITSQMDLSNSDSRPVCPSDSIVRSVFKYSCLELFGSGLDIFENGQDKDLFGPKEYTIFPLVAYVDNVTLVRNTGSESARCPLTKLPTEQNLHCSESTEINSSSDCQQITYMYYKDSNELQIIFSVSISERKKGQILKGEIQIHRHASTSRDSDVNCRSLELFGSGRTVIEDFLINWPSCSLDSLKSEDMYDENTGHIDSSMSLTNMNTCEGNARPVSSKHPKQASSWECLPPCERTKVRCSKDLFPISECQAVDYCGTVFSASDKIGSLDCNDELQTRNKMPNKITCKYKTDTSDAIDDNCRSFELFGFGRDAYHLVFGPRKLRNLEGLDSLTSDDLFGTKGNRIASSRHNSLIFEWFPYNESSNLQENCDNSSECQVNFSVSTTNIIGELGVEDDIVTYDANDCCRSFELFGSGSDPLHGGLINNFTNKYNDGLDSSMSEDMFGPKDSSSSRFNSDVCLQSGEEQSNRNLIPKFLMICRSINGSTKINSLTDFLQISDYPDEEEYQTASSLSTLGKIGGLDCKDDSRIRRNLPNKINCKFKIVIDDNCRSIELVGSGRDPLPGGWDVPNDGLDSIKSEDMFGSNEDRIDSSISLTAYDSNITCRSTELFGSGPCFEGNFQVKPQPVNNRNYAECQGNGNPSATIHAVAEILRLHNLVTFKHLYVGTPNLGSNGIMDNSKFNDIQLIPNAMSQPLLLRIQSVNIQLQVFTNVFPTQNIADVKRYLANITKHPNTGIVMDLTLNRLIREGKAFKVETCLGKGGFGCVYKCTETNSSESNAFCFAMKCVSRHHFNHHEVLTSLEIDTPGLLRCYGFVIKDDRVYILQEYFTGKTLRKFLDNGGPSLKLDEKKKIIHNLLDTVHQLHKRNRVHWDIKDSNIMIKETPGISGSLDFDVKLIDLGSVKELDHLHRNLIGDTPENRPPEYRETWRNRGCSEMQAYDVWGIGIVFYKILKGNKMHPFPNQSSNENIYETVDTLLKQQTECEGRMANLLRSLLMFDSSERINTGQALKHPLFQDQNLHTTDRGKRKRDDTKPP